MNISILASIGCQNLGDELILKNEIALLEQKYNSKKIRGISKKDNIPGGISFRVFSYDYQNPFFTKENIKYSEYFPAGIKQPKNIFRNLYNLLIFINTISCSDIVVIGGGGIIYDRENQSVANPLDQILFRVKTARFFRKKIVFYGIGIDIKDRNNYEKIKNIFYKAHEIYVRDNSSYNFLGKLGISSKVILDPVFNDGLKYERNKKMCIKKIDSKKFILKDIEVIDFNNKKVGIAFRSGFFNNQLNKKLGSDLEILKVKEIINYIESSGGEVILLPHSFHKTDTLANDYKFLKKCMLKETKICKTMKETYNYYSQKKLDICLAERLHSMILSEVYSIPFIGFMYGEKTKELLR